jgi:dihydroneopterin triphosphate diphosphatase
MPEIVAGNVDVYVYRVVDGQRQYLLMRRAPGRLYAGTWRMVTGKIKPGEQAWQSAARELWEETGLHPAEFFTLPSMNSFYEWQTDRLMLVAAFGARVAGDPSLNEEHDTSEWVSLDAALSRLAWSEHRRLLGLLDGMTAVGGEIPDSLRIPVS